MCITVENPGESGCKKPLIHTQLTPHKIYRKKLEIPLVNENDGDRTLEYGLLMIFNEIVNIDGRGQIHSGIKSRRQKCWHSE